MSNFFLRLRSAVQRINANYWKLADNVNYTYVVPTKFPVECVTKTSNSFVFKAFFGGDAQKNDIVFNAKTRRK